RGRQRSLFRKGARRPPRRVRQGGFPLVRVRRAPEEQDRRRTHARQGVPRELQRLVKASDNRELRQTRRGARLREQHVGERERVVQGRRREQLQRRPHRTWETLTWWLLRDRDELARRRSRARRIAHAHPPHIPLRG